MASLLAASAAKRRLPILMSFYARLSSSPCNFELREGEVEEDGGQWARESCKAGKIYGASPEVLEKRVYKNCRPVFKGGFHRIHPCCISETKCDNKPEIEVVSELMTAKLSPSKEKLQQDDTIPSPLPISAEASDIFPKPQTADIFMRSYDQDGDTYFRAYSVDEEDGSLLPKHLVYTPLSLKKQKWKFHGATCNGVFHLMNDDWEQILWNPTTEECKTLPMSFVPCPPLDAQLVVSGMWYDHTRENYKLLQLVTTYTLVEERIRTGVCYWIWLYSFKSDSWKKIPFTDFTVCNHTSACINDVYYCEASFGEPEESRGIMSFNFSTETLSKIDSPPFSDDKNVRYQILEYKGLLSIVVYSEGLFSTPRKYELWVMNDGLWIRESVFHGSIRVGKPKWFSKNGRFLYFDSKDGGVVFDRATGKSKKLHISTEKYFPFR